MFLQTCTSISSEAFVLVCQQIAGAGLAVC